MPLNLLAAVPLLASLALSYRASPGTVYVAADSRLTETESEAGLQVPPSDTACKIRVLKDGVVFVGTGNAYFSAGQIRTNIYALAARAAATLPVRPLEPADVRRIALAWQSTVHQRLAARMQSEPQPALASELSSTGTTGAFYAATAEGDVYGITLRVALDRNGFLEDIEEPQALGGYLVATGTNAAKQQSLAIAATQRNASLPWPRRLQAIEQQTIQTEARLYGRRSDIGGPVDVIEITPKGPVWLARKANCQ